MKKQLITTTFAELHKAKACKARYRRLAKALGGIKNYGKDTPINMLRVLEHNGYNDFDWALWESATSLSIDILSEYDGWYDNMDDALCDGKDKAEQLKIAREYLK